jgi:hypothetical protein
MITHQPPDSKHGAALDGNRKVLRELLARIDFSEAMRRRAVQQAISDARSETWRRRAQDFRAAAPKPGDYSGRASLSELAERGQECLNIARACEAHATLLEEIGPREDDLAADEVAS